MKMECGSNQNACAMRALGVVLVCVTLAVPASGFAQWTTAARDAQALQLYQAGETAFAAGEYDSALQLFESAYELSHRPGLLYNMGHCADRLRRDEDAIRWFDAYLEAAPADAANREEAERRLRALREAEAARQVEVSRLEAAQAAAVGAPASASASHDVTNEAWFWPVIGGGAALVIGGIVVGIVIASQPQPEPGNIGGIVSPAQSGCRARG